MGGITISAAIGASKGRVTRSTYGAAAIVPGAISSPLCCSPGVYPCSLMATNSAAPQHGNNNAYCQDNELSWVDWSSFDEDFLAFAQRLTELRRRYPLLRDDQSGDLNEIIIRSAGGDVLRAEDWQRDDLRAFALHLSGEPDMILAVNGAPERVDFHLPAAGWQQVLATSSAHLEERQLADDLLSVESLSLSVVVG